MSFFNRSRGPSHTLALYAGFLFLGGVFFFPFAYNRFHYDDFFWVSILEENMRYNHWIGFWSLDMSQFKGFFASWWAETKNPGEFFRPVFSEIFALCFRTFGRSSALPLHIISIFLHATNAFTTFLLLRRMSGRHAVSLLAGLLFLISEDHSMTVGWISTASDLIAVFFINLSLIFYIEFRHGGSRITFLAFILFMLLAFAGKETAVAAPVFILLYEWIFASADAGLVSLRRMQDFFGVWKSWIWAAILVLGFLIFYKLSGFGTNNLAYYDPLKEPGRYLSSLAMNLPTMYTGYLSVFPIGLGLFLPSAVPFLAAAGVILFLLFAMALFHFRSDRMLQFCFLFFPIALIPQLATEATERQLYFPLVTGIYGISFLIFQIPFLKRRIHPDAKPAPRPVRIVGYYLFVSSLLLPLFMTPVYSFVFRESLESPEKAVEKARVLATGRKPGAVVHINGPGPFFAFYAPDIYRFYENRYVNVRVLSSFNGKLWIRRDGPRSLLLKTDGPGWLSGMFAKIVRLNPNFTVGQKFSNDTFTVTILKTTPDTRDILEASFEFSKALNDPYFLFIAYRDGEMKTVDFSADGYREWTLAADTSNTMENM